MSYLRAPVFHFMDKTEVGIYDIPEDAVIFIASESKMYKKTDNTGLVSTSTLQDAINNGNLIDFTVENLTDLKDIDINSVALLDKDVLLFNALTSQWENILSDTLGGTKYIFDQRLFNGL